jgi:phage shock protein PspC (stress-responsive transcriptional regulator)
MSEQKRLVRVREGAWLGGVCLGLANYLSIDPVFIRLAFALLAFNGIGVVLYFFMWILIPDDTLGERSSESVTRANVRDIGERARSLSQALGAERGAMFAGLALVVVGGLLLTSHFLPMINLSLLWPLALIGLGVAVLVRGR